MSEEEKMSKDKTDFCHPFVTKVFFLSNKQGLTLTGNYIFIYEVEIAK
jgi:hypothetical protein